MKLIIKKELDTKKPLLVLGWFSDQKNYYKNFNTKVHEKIITALKNKTFSEKTGSLLRIMMHDSLYDEILVVSLGSTKNLNPERVRKALSRGANHCKSFKITGFTTNIADLARGKINTEKLGLACGEACVLSSYIFNKYTEKSKHNVSIKEIVFSWNGKDSKKLNDFINKGAIIGEATNFAKDLVNEPACVANPEFLEKQAREIAKSNLIKLKILTKKDLEKQGMNLILAVGNGSINEPRMLVLDYIGLNKKPEHVLVGKGITFDTGGYNIKPTGYMEEMKSDMAGAAALLGTMKALTLLKPKISVSAIIPLAENMVSSKAYRPSDIIRGMNGKTVEVLNTDAEGRLILADALSYAVKNYKESTLIDIATLTGAAIFATGHVVAPMVGNDEALLKKLKEAGLESNDRVWTFPFFEDYQDWMDSDIADIANISKKFDRSAGSIAGGVFLSKFVDKAKWAHIDIAGTAYLKENSFYNQKYASGAGVRLFCYFLNKF